MLNIYTKKELLPLPLEQDFNETFFQTSMTFDLLNKDDFNIIEKIDNATLISGEDFRTPFGVTKIENLSTGCKTVLNALHNPDRCFNLVECGDNAVTELAIACQKQQKELHAFLPHIRDIQDNMVVLSLNGKVVKGSDEFYNAWREIEDE